MDLEKDAADSGLVMRGLGLHMREIRGDARECDFVASTNAVDHYGDIVEQDWILDIYKQNPIALYAHDRWDLPIGQCTRCEVKSGQLECTIKFASAEANPKAEQVWKLVQEKVLRAVSVGFRSKNYRLEKRDDKEVWVLSGNTLLEISVVPIPANPDALAKSRAVATERAKALATTTTLTKAGAQAAPGERAMDLEKQLKAAEEKALTAEKALAVAEAKNVELESALAASKKDAEALRVDVAAKDKAIASVTAERDKACDDLATARKTIVTQEVDSFVGKKFPPAEREVMLELALTNAPLFKKTIEARPDMRHTDQVVTPEAKAPPHVSVSGDHGDALAALLDKKA